MATSYGSALVSRIRPSWCWRCSSRSLWPLRPPSSTASLPVAWHTQYDLAAVAYMGIVPFAAFFLKTALSSRACHYGRPVPGAACRRSAVANGRIIPGRKSNEYYGFFDIFGRYASVMGTFPGAGCHLADRQPVAGRPFYWRAAAGCWLCAAGPSVPHGSGGGVRQPGSVQQLRLSAVLF